MVYINRTDKPFGSSRRSLIEPGTAIETIVATQSGWKGTGVVIEDYGDTIEIAKDGFEGEAALASLTRHQFRIKRKPKTEECKP